MITKEQYQEIKNTVERYSSRLKNNGYPQQYFDGVAFTLDIIETLVPKDWQLKKVAK